ncbi:hypothetical protein [Yinghuangia soli]|uniref:SH3 domain-containing protein n=1 Tax=Yinghuangia soli TaxID=2908204 RepID=A0AA41PYM4_9ACTN|nr:hypothetical protein [Yinghuangia soli]MCF2527571.1 hypothetical protein [Yinghuangia soli]
MMGSGIRERWQLRREAAADAPRRPRPGLVAPVVLVVFFLLVVLIVVKMGGGEETAQAAGSGSETGQGDPAQTESPEPTGPPVAGPEAIPGTVKSRFALAVYKQPAERGKPVLSAERNTRVMVECHIAGQVRYVSGVGDPTWARVIVSGKRGYVHVGHIETGGVVAQQVPACE